MVAPPRHLHHNVALSTRWCLWRLGRTLGEILIKKIPEMNWFIIFFVCALFNLFFCEMRNEKWEMIGLHSYIVQKKTEAQLWPFCQEFRKAQKLLSPEFRLISTWSTAAHLPISPYPNWPKERWPKKGAKSIRRLFFQDLEWLAFAILSNPLSCVSWGTRRVISNTFEWVRELRTGN